MSPTTSLRKTDQNSVNQVDQLTHDQALGLAVNQQLYATRTSHNSLGAQLGLSQSTISRKVRGLVPWTSEEVSLTALYFGLTAADLLPSPDGRGGWVPAVFRPGRGKGPDRSRSGPLSVAGAGFEPTTSGYARFIDLDGGFCLVA